MASAYSPEQVDAFLEHIQLPQHLRDAKPSVPLLNALHIHTISTFPFENLSVHYSADRVVDINPQSLYAKMITNSRGRGGYCLEIAILYNHILRALGFDVHTAGVRTRKRIGGVPQGDYPGWSHITNIVTFPDGSKYHDDVAFGGDGPTLAMPMIEDVEHVNLGTQTIRLVREWIPAQVKRTEETKLWIYQYRNSNTVPWNSFYAFAEIEFTPSDWEVVNWYTYSSPKSTHLEGMIVNRFLRCKKEEHEGEGEDEVYEIQGKRILAGATIKRNLGGKTQIVKQCSSEEERVEELEDYFGIMLTEDERAGIKGRAMELRS